MKIIIKLLALLLSCTFMGNPLSAMNKQKDKKKANEAVLGGSLEAGNFGNYLSSLNNDYYRPVDPDAMKPRYTNQYNKNQKKEIAPKTSFENSNSDTFFSNFDDNDVMALGNDIDPIEQACSSSKDKKSFAEKARQYQSEKSHNKHRSSHSHASQIWHEKMNTLDLANQGINNNNKSSIM